MDELNDFHREFLAEVQGEADAQGLITTEAFLEKMGELLDEAGELSSFAQCYHEGNFKRKPVQVDAYGWDAEDEEGVLSLVISDFHRDSEPGSIGKTDANRLLSRLVQFVMASLDREYRDGLEESSQAYALADLVRRCWKKITKIKLILVTNKVNKSKTDAQPVGKIGEIPVTSNVWDLGRIQRFIEAGQTREDLVIDFAEDFGEAIPILRASSGSPLESYIAVIPGSQLASIYDRWGARLLEANVRSFLQARGKVNGGIRDTIRKDPAMFFSYNNGLTTTAESVEVASIGEGLFLMSASNFQIVNGGQTTASIHAARKMAAEQLNDVYVQMKLTVVPSEHSETVVPNISQFANSQNKVNAADFFANHPFHIRMEEYSRRMLAPIGDTGYREHKWFYERARGQFADERGRRTPAERKSFDAMFPKSQFFTKTDLAKFENSYRCKPHVVSFGAQKNFAELARVIGDEWGKSDGAPFNETWFQRLIAKAIIFRNLERIVPAQPWYTGGYRANIVTYAIAKLVHDAGSRDRVIDLDAVWRLQRVHVDLERALLATAEAANDVITNPPAGVRNMSEWAKKQACWAELAKRTVAYGTHLDSVVIEREAVRAVDRDTRIIKRELNGIEAQREVVNQGGEYWSQLLAFGRSIGKLAPKEAGILQACTSLPNRIPSEKQCVAAVAIADKLEQYYQPA